MMATYEAVGVAAEASDAEAAVQEVADVNDPKQPEPSNEASGPCLPTLMTGQSSPSLPKGKSKGEGMTGDETTKSRAEQIEKEKSTHIENFTARTGMTPKTCYRIVLTSLLLRLLGTGWIAMVAMEYARYYVINDLSLLNFVQTATNSPQMAIQAFLFPVWGVVADRVSRKKVLVAASIAQCASAVLMTTVPCVEIFIFTRLLNLVSDIGGPIRDAMLRDLFCDVEWESEGGGVTGIKSRMALIGGVASAISMAVGATLLAGGKMELSGFLPNEYAVHKDQCKGHTYCVPHGQFSYEGSWHVDGCLRLMMIMGSTVLIIDSLMVIFLLPETIRPEQRRQGSLWSFLSSSWKELGQPWNNLRVFATPQTRRLIGIREIGYIVSAGGSSAFISFYARYDFDTLTMYCFSASAMMAGWLMLIMVPRLVERYGDMKGIWIPGTIGALMFAIASAFCIGDVGFALTFVIFPLFAGPSFALQGIAPELIAKMIPGDLQATFQTGKSFLFRLTMAIFLWPWMGLQVMSADWGYPFDALPLMGTAALGFVALYFTVRLARTDDPKDAIERGDALVEFWQSDYARGKWYQQHTSGSSIAEGDDADAEDHKPERPEMGIGSKSTFLPSAGSTNMSLPTFSGLEDGLSMARQRRRIRRSGSNLSTVSQASWELEVQAAVQRSLSLQSARSASAPEASV